MHFKQIDPAEIDLSDERFRVSFPDSLDDLTASIRDVGLLNPPVLTKREDRLVLVTGWRRILACSALALSPISVFVEEGKDDLELFWIAVYENTSNRSLSVVEKAEILARLQEFGAPQDELLRRALPLLGIPSTKEYLDLFLAAAGMDPAEKKLVHQKDPSPAVLQAFLSYSSEERARLSPWLWTLGQNKQKELLGLLGEIAARDGISPKQVLAHPRIRDLAEEKKLSPRQQAGKLLIHLRGQRNPTLTAWSQAFEAALRNLGIEKGIVIDPSPFFEGEDLALHFSFRSREEFLERLARLKGMADRPEFAGLFKDPGDE